MRSRPTQPLARTSPSCRDVACNVSTVGCAVVGALLALTAAAEPLNYEDHVRPVLRASCLKCHNADTTKGGLDLSTYSALLKGGSSGAIVQPGEPDGSRLVRCVAHLEEPFMPPKASKRPDGEIATLRQWIADGLIERAGGSARKATPAATVAVAAVTQQRPEGPTPLPLGLPLEPAIVAERAGSAMAIAASPWAPVIALGGHRQVLLYHAQTLDPLGVLPFPEGTPYVLRFSRNGRLLLCGGGVEAASGRVVIWDVLTGARMATVGDELDAVLAADLSPDQSKVALGGSDRLVKIYQVADGALLQKIKKHTDWITAVEFSPDGVLLASGDRNGGLVLWETASGQEYQVLAGHQAAVTSVRWRRDSNLLASGGEDGFARQWNPEDGAQVRNWTAHKDGVLAVDFAADGRLATSGRDRKVVVWDAAGKELKAIRDFGDLPLRVAFADEDKRLVAGDWLGSVRVSAVESGATLGQLELNPPRVLDRIERELAALREVRDGGPARKEEVAKLLVALKAEQATAADRKKVADTAGAARQSAESAATAAIAARDRAQSLLVTAKADAEARTKKLAEAEVAIQAEAGRLAAARAMFQQRESELPGLRQRVPEVQAALAAARQRADEAAGRRHALTQAEAAEREQAGRLGALEQTLARHRAEVERLSAFLASSTNGPHPEETRQLAEQKAAQQTAEAGQPALKQSADAAKASADAARATAQGLADEPTLRGAVTAAEQAVKEAEEKAAAGQRALQEAQAEADRLAGVFAAAEAALRDARKSAEEGGATVAARQQELAAATAAVPQAEQQRDVARAAAETATKALADAEGVLATARKAHATAQQADAESEQRLAALERRLVTLKAAQFDALVTAASQRIESKGGKTLGVADTIRKAQAAVERMPVRKPRTPRPADDSAKPAGHPALLFLGRFHIVLLHLPIACLLAAFPFEVWRSLRRREHASPAAGLLLDIGAVGALVTAALGLLLAANGKYDAAALEGHRLWGVSAAILAGVAALAQRCTSALAKVKMPAALAAMGCIAWASHLGGTATHGAGFLSEYLPHARAALAGQPATAPAASGEFAERIQPVLEEHCLSCHGPKKPKGKYRLDTRAHALKGGASGEPAIVPGSALESELVRRILLPREHDDVMPPSDKPELPAAAALELVRWIERGAEWPEAQSP